MNTMFVKVLSVGIALLISPFIYRYRASDNQFHKIYIFSFLSGIILIITAVLLYYP